MSLSMTAEKWKEPKLFTPIKIKTPPKPVVKPRRSYSPSWFKKSEMKREQIMTKNDASFSPRPSDIVAGLTARSFKSPVSFRSASHHEQLEQQYQDLRKLMVERNEQIKQESVSKSAQTLPLSSRTAKTNKSTKSTHSTKSEFILNESVSVKDFLQSNEYGSDHFSKHLSCVKKLAKRYRRHRRPHKFRTVIEIIE